MENNNRPVFESFDDFVKFVYGDAIYESLKLENLSELQSTLGSYGMEEAGKRALSEIESLASQAGVGFTSGDLQQLSLVLSRLNIPDVTKIESVDIYTNEKTKFVYDNLRGGAVKTQDGKKVGLAQFLTKANRENLVATGVSKIPQVDKKKKIFDLNEAGDFLAGSGLIGNYLPVQSEGTLDLKKYTFENPVQNSIIDLPGNADPITKALWKNKNLNKSPSQSHQKNLSVIYALYYPIAISDGGQPYESKEVETYVRPVPTISEKLKPIVVQEDLPLFKVNTAELTEDGKVAIMQALSNVSSAKSIKIRGGASQEGTLERNKELCKLRAEAVAEFLKPTFPGATITADPEGDIQPLKPETDEKTRKTFRKITMDVDGTTLVKQTGTKDETVTMINTVKKRAQKVEIKVCYIVLNSSIIA